MQCIQPNWSAFSDLALYTRYSIACTGQIKTNVNVPVQSMSYKYFQLTNNVTLLGGNEKAGKGKVMGLLGTLLICTHFNYVFTGTALWRAHLELIFLLSYVTFFLLGY